MKYLTLVFLVLWLAGCGSGSGSALDNFGSPAQTGVTVRIETTNPLPDHQFRVHVHAPGSDQDLVPPQTVSVQSITTVNLGSVPAEAAVVAVHTLGPANQHLHTHRAEFIWRSQVEVPLRVTIRKLRGVPATATVRANGRAVTLSAFGGSGGYRYVLENSNSGGRVAENTGVYSSGPNRDTLDTIELSDSNGDTALIPINVSPTLSVVPPAANVEPGGTVDFTATGNLSRPVWDILVNRSGGRIDPLTGRYVAGPHANVQDVVEVTTARGSDDIRHRTVLVCVGSPLSIDVPSQQPTVGTTLTCVARAGSGQGYRWHLVDGPSGGHVDPLTGVYTAGPEAGVTDVLAVSDSEGSVKTLNLLVTPPIRGLLSIGVPIDQEIGFLLPAAGGRALTYTASGGSGQGYRWSLPQNLSGGRVDPVTGVYTPGPTGGVTDLLAVTDSAGGVATLQLSVAPPVTIRFDPSGPVPAFTTVQYHVSGGYPPYRVFADRILQTQPSITPVDDVSVVVLDLMGNAVDATIKVTR